MKITFKKIKDVKEIMGQNKNTYKYSDFYNDCIMGVTSKNEIIYDFQSMIRLKIHHHLFKEKDPNALGGTNWNLLKQYFIPIVIGEIAEIDASKKSTQILPILCDDIDFLSERFRNPTIGSVLSYGEDEEDYDNY